MKKLILVIGAVLAIASCVEKNAKKPEYGNPTLETIMTRYSVRSYTGQKVSKEQIDTLLRAGMAAPSGMNLQPWRFVVVTDTTTMKAMTPWGADTWIAAGTVIVVCGDTLDNKGQSNKLWEMDCSAVTENILLAAKSMGLGAVCNAAYPWDEFYRMTQKALGLPENIIPMSIIPVGYEQGSEEPKQKYDQSKIHFEKW